MVFFPYQGMNVKYLNIIQFFALRCRWFWIGFSKRNRHL